MDGITFVTCGFEPSEQNILRPKKLLADGCSHPPLGCQYLRNPRIAWGLRTQDFSRHLHIDVHN